ncbi:hypothetical protein BDR03DRAFT_653387 [Suillus americanus]|nr:hypothetical protein BDR03DRAFT_653387 [Suillus americanus]
MVSHAIFTALRSTAYHGFMRRSNSAPYKFRVLIISGIVHLIYSVMSEQHSVADVHWNNNISRSSISEQDAVFGLRWNDYISLATITLISYEYLLLLDKEVTYVWKRPWSPMSYLYLIVRYLGLFLALLWGFWGGLLYMPESVSYHLVVFMEWGYSAYTLTAQIILIWRLYALYNRSKLLLRLLLGLFLPIVAVSIGTDIFLYSRSSVFSVQEITAGVEYCTFSFNMGPKSAIYWAIPMVCFDILLVVLAAARLAKHTEERKKMNVRPNSSISMIVRLHIVCFVLNLMSQVFLVIIWANISTQMMNIAELFNSIVPYILAPRLIVSIWDTHAHDKCVYVSKTFEDCGCWTSPRMVFEEHEMYSEIESEIGGSCIA